jgi:hypothetical protein
MANYPDWNAMTDAQKFEFLHEWLINVEGAIKRLGSQDQALFERLRRVEAKAEETAS